MENTNMESVQTADTIITQNSNGSSKSYSFGWLVKHIRNIFMFRTGSRISRGEYFLAIVLLGIVSVVVMTIFMRLYRLLVNEYASIGSINIMWIVLGLVYLVFFIWQMGLGVKRLKDLNMSPWWIIFLFTPIITLIVPAFMLGYITKHNSNNGLFTILFAILAIVIFIIFIVITIKLMFKRGNKGSNRYGDDPLDHQPTSNKNYWLLFLVFIVINILLSFTSGLDNSMERAMLRGAGFDQSQIEMMQKSNSYMNPDNTTVDTTSDGMNDLPSDSASDTSTSEETSPIETTPTSDSTSVTDDAALTEQALSNPAGDDSDALDQ